MINIYLQLGLYYFAVIVGIFLHRCFSKFIARDFLYNHTLKIKRRCGIFYFYGIMVWGIYMVHMMKDSSYTFDDNFLNLSIIPSIFIILLYFAHTAVSLESPKKFHKKRKWK